MSEFIPLIKPGDVACKNTGRLIVVKIRGKEYEFRKETIDVLSDIMDFVVKAKRPTDWITGYEEIAKEETMELWPEDKDPIVGGV